MTVGATPTGLAEGQISVGMADQPPTAWVGVPASVNPAGVIPITGLVRTVAGAPQPAGALGQLWWDEDGAQLYVYTGAEWVVAVNLFGGASVSFPASPAANQIVTDSSTGATWRWDAPTTRWVPAATGATFVTPAQLTTALGGYLPLTGGTLAGPGGAGGTLGVQDQLNVVSATQATVNLQTAAQTWRIAVSLTGGSISINNVNTGAQPFGIATNNITFMTETTINNPTNNFGQINFGPTGNQYALGMNTASGLLQMTSPVGMMFASTYDGNFTITGNAWKPGGNVWQDSSDARIKTVHGDYLHGLNEIEQLEPRRYTFRGNDDNDGHKKAAEAQTEFVGLIAQEVEDMMPEMVAKQKGKIDGQEVDDLRVLDTSPLIYALVNAVKELSQRVKELENAAS